MTIRDFLVPRFTRTFVIRAASLALVTFIIFRFVLLPIRVEGISMEPTYHDRAVNLCFQMKYLFRHPARYDVVLVRLAGLRVAYLKRIVALPGETVEFKAGKLLINGTELPEPYVQMSCDWVLPARRVAPGSVYVIGDNRGIPLDQAEFGETTMSRIVGGPLW